VTGDDVMNGAACMVSVFIREPEFQGQTKDRLATGEATRIVENAIRDPFDHWLAANPMQANKLLDFVIERAEERIRRRQEKESSRKSAVRKLRLPGKLADCTNTAAQGAEIFIVEGDSAGGSAKQARDRASQAVLPLRGKILNVASAGKDKLAQNQQLADLMQALGCGTGAHYRDDDLRYAKVIVMTDADFKGLGEMMANQLKETTMDPKTRTLLRVVVVEDERKKTDSSVERLMGNKPEARFEFIQERAEFADKELLDV